MALHRQTEAIHEASVSLKCGQWATIVLPLTERQRSNQHYDGAAATASGGYLACPSTSAVLIPVNASPIITVAHAVPSGGCSQLGLDPAVWLTQHQRLAGPGKN